VKIAFLILPCIIFPVIVLNAGLFPQVAQASPAAVSDGSYSADAVVVSQSAQNSHIVDSAVSAPLEQASPASALNDFAATLKNGQAGQVVGVYVHDVFSLKVAPQPSNNPAYVNSDPGYATQFSLASQYGSIGLLAHNYLSGSFFSSLTTGQEVDIIYGDGSVRRYSISVIRHFQALSPLSTASNFVDLDNPRNNQLSNSDLFHQIYNQGDRVVFQTCITANGDTSWGRLFVIATPISY
jgi:hypothetical protein